ncbi:MAG TPA: hypothetical protein VFV87_04885 [Pirellulaceae bacterium]|nr:hypothetical protein [Pirellulaceae bacterium]
MRRRLDALKQQGARDRQRKDLIWYLLLSAATTLGNASGFDRLFGNHRLTATVSYAALVRLKPAQQRKRLLAALKQAGVRYASKKSKQLSANLREIQRRGGVESETRRALSLQGRDSKRNYFLQFAGIGPKYANNIWMDIYDDDFHDCVAVDARLSRVLHELQVDVTCSQSFFQQIARDANLQTWEVDRLLFGFTDYFIAAIRW